MSMCCTFFVSDRDFSNTSLVWLSNACTPSSTEPSSAAALRSRKGISEKLYR